MDHYQEFAISCNLHGVIGRHEGERRKARAFSVKGPRFLNCLKIGLDLFVAPVFKRMCGTDTIKRRKGHTRHQQSHRYHHAHDCTFHCIESFRWSAIHGDAVHSLNSPCWRDSAGCLCSR